MQTGTTAVSLAAFFFFKKAAIRAAILGQKNITLYLSKVITSGMYNCNFEAIN